MGESGYKCKVNFYSGESTNLWSKHFYMKANDFNHCVEKLTVEVEKMYRPHVKYTIGYIIETTESWVIIK